MVFGYDGRSRTGAVEVILQSRPLSGRSVYGIVTLPNSHRLALWTKHWLIWVPHDITHLLMFLIDIKTLNRMKCCTSVTNSLPPIGYTNLHVWHMERPTTLRTWNRRSRNCSITKVEHQSCIYWKIFCCRVWSGSLKKRWNFNSHFSSEIPIPESSWYWKIHLHHHTEIYLIYIGFGYLRVRLMMDVFYQRIGGGSTVSFGCNCSCKKQRDILKLDYLETGPRHKTDFYIIMLRKDHPDYKWLGILCDNSAKNSAHTIINGVHNFAFRTV